MKASERVFVFGSNLAGVHGAGAAAVAYKSYGARWGLGYGFCGQSYAIPTKDRQIETLPLDKILYFVDRFLLDALEHPERQFNVTQVGCGLAGLQPIDIAPMFRALPNVWYDRAWEPWLGPEAQYWTDEQDTL